MKLETIALIGICAIGGVLAVIYGGLIIYGAIATFPFGLPGLVVIGLFVFVAIGVLRQRLNNTEDDYYEKNIHE